jgi:hypothetical protein
VLLGGGGMEFGLAIYPDLRTVRSLFAGTLGLEEGAEVMTGLALNFGEAFDIPPPELDAAETHGWPIAGPEAYPHVYFVDRTAIRPPKLDELELMEACLRVIPGHVARHGQEDRTTETVRVPLLSGEADLTLAWTEERGA